MTDHKSRKHLIRERMARTGESYTTAHRQVLAQRVAPNAIPGTVPGYPRPRPGQHHPSILARNLLAQAGLQISEPMACGLGGGIGFLYAIFDYRELPHQLLTIVMQHHPQPWFEAITEHLGVATTTVTSSAPAPALRELDAALASGGPALIVVGRGLLPWHPGLPEMEAADMCPVVVAGQLGEEYLVDEGDEPRWIGRDELGAAWAAYRKGRFALTTVADLPADVDLGPAISAALATTVDHLTGPVLHNYFDANMGHRGLAKFVAELRDTGTKNGWARRFSDPDAFAAAMHRLAECVTWQHTAPGGTRPLYAKFLTEAAGTAGLDLLGAAGAAGRAGETWTRLADLAGPAADPEAVTHRDAAAERRQVLDELADLADEALRLETELVGHLREALR